MNRRRADEFRTDFESTFFELGTWSNAAIIGCSLLLFLSFPAFCQDEAGPEDQDPNSKQVEQILSDTLLQAEQSVFISAPREVLRPLIRANKAILENETTKAVTLLGEVLNETTSEDYLVPVMGTEGLSVSLRLRAQMTLGSLPAKDRGLYRLRYGVQAKQMLENAIETSDFDLVSQVMQRFFFTPAGFEAAMLLGHHHLDEGRPIAAANCFDRIVNSDEARAIYDPEASVLLATCWMMGDDEAAATEALVRLRANSRQDSIRFLGKPVRLFDDPADAQVWLKKLIGDSPLLQNEMVNQWMMVGGNPQRNARTGMGLPLINPRWSTPTLNNPDMEKMAVDHLRELVFLDSAPIPAVQPLAIGNTVVMRAYDQMIGVDFETGKRVWVFPPWDFTTDFSQPTEPLKPRTVGEAPLNERMWLDSVYGQASSDGRNIFVVPDPGFSRDVGYEVANSDEPAVVREYNELMAIDIAREGAFRWEIGGESGFDEPKLAKTFFLGPPLPLQDELFAVCKQENEIKLVALDADNGRLKWSQTLGTTENLGVNLSDDRFRRLASVSPSFANGVLVCATGTGALTAVDLSTHSLLWGFQYTTPGKKAVSRISPGKTSSADPLSGIWRDSSIVISDGKVLFTPVETQELICVNLRDGTPAWKNGQLLSAKSPRADSLFIACVENGLAVLVGESSVRAIDLQTGKQAWETKLDQHGRPSGRGYANSGCYFFPTTSEELIQVELKTGEIVKSVRTDGVLGNLVCHRGDVISHGVERLASFPQDEPKRQLLAAANSSEELSADLLAIRAQLQLQDNDLRAAIESIELAYQKEPNRTYENLLLDLVIRIVEEDFPSGIKLAEKYRPQLLANRRFQYLAANVNGMMREKQYNNAFDALIELIQPVEQISQLREEMIPVLTARYDSFGKEGSVSGETRNNRAKANIRLDQWIASRIGLLHQRGPVDLKLRIETELAQAVKQILVLTSDPEKQDLALGSIPMALVAPQIKLDLASRLFDAGFSLRAIKLLNSMVDDSDPNLSGAAVAAKFTILSQQKDFTILRHLLVRLETEFANVEVTANTTGAEIAARVKNSPDFLNVKSEPAKWNSRHVTSKFQEIETEVERLVPCNITLQSYDQPEYAEYEYRFFGQTGEIEIIDANGKSAHRFFARRTIETLDTNYNSYVGGRISIHENLALLDIAKEMFAFDWLKLKNGENPMLWNKAIRSGPHDTRIAAVSQQWKEVSTTTTERNYEQRVYVGAPGLTGICYLENSQLICLDALTGQKIWHRTSILPYSILFGDSNQVVVWNGKQRRADVIDVASGQLVKSTELDPEVGAIWKSSGTKVLVSTLRRKKDAATKPSSPAPNGTPPKEDSEQEIDHVANMEKTLGLYDLIADNFVWQSAFPMETMGCLVGQDRVALLTREKRIVVREVATGEAVFEQSLNFDDLQHRQISGIGVVVRGDKLLFHFKRGDTYNRVELEPLNVELKYINYNDEMWKGALVCLDAKSGASVWRNPVLFDNFQLGQSQPANLPVYVLVRRVEKDDEFGNRRDYLNFASIDMETGELLLNELQPHGYPNNISYEYDPAAQQVEIRFANSLITYGFSSPNDLPPRPVAFLSDDNSVPNVNTGDSTFHFDKELLQSQTAATIERAQAAEKLMRQRQVEERLRLQEERADK